MWDKKGRILYLTTSRSTNRLSEEPTLQNMELNLYVYHDLLCITHEGCCMAETL